MLEDWDDKIVGVEGLSSLEIMRLRMSRDSKKMEVMQNPWKMLGEMLWASLTWNGLNGE